MQCSESIIGGLEDKGDTHCIVFQLKQSLLVPLCVYTDANIIWSPEPAVKSWNPDFILQPYRGSLGAKPSLSVCVQIIRNSQ